MLNTAEAARFLRVSEASIRRWTDAGHLPARRVGGRRERRFIQADLVAFMEHQRGSDPGPSSVTIGGTDVRLPGHLATFLGSDEGGLRLSVPFLAEGVRLGQPSIVVGSEAVLARYVGALKAAVGRDVRELDVAAFTSVTFGAGTAAGAIAEWEQRLGALVGGGAKVIRIVGEMASEREMFDSEDEMLRYEEAFELMSKRYPAVVMCQYDVREFSGVAMLRAMKAHPDMFEFSIGSFLN